ncbi:amidase [Nitrososphaera sp. AFS]|jgi:aspartyl-tRNA(Asn)/glutamyl-tRNA(Gln) amidotransferase subunit A|uniref:amidase n=1 Tax=Nitrososphaera sp. AFS TaxID=2301191 RepID=UPI0013924985|nr:amidase [Nitrososphaera sp. AFS]NAL78313.1 amidase [Nitrososphaera sp. AFS]
MAKRSQFSLLSLKELSEKIQTSEITPVDLTEFCLDRIRKLNKSLNAFITVADESDAYNNAGLAEKEIRSGNYRGPLHGIPFSIKDIIYAKGIRCTAGSKILSDYIPQTDATCFKKIKKAGAIFLGTNNLNEFASGITGVNPFYGNTKNPWDMSRISGGSSGGSAVAVSTGMSQIALGTDTGGSLRVPSSLCGVVGLKPTYGLISKHGVFPLAPSLDHVGCITRSVWDSAAILECISGWDPYDLASSRRKIPQYTKIIEKSDAKGLAIGVPKDYFFDYVDYEVERLFNQFVENLKSLEYKVSDIGLQNYQNFCKTWRDIRYPEATAVHEDWFKTRTEGYSLEVRKMLILGTKVSAIDYLQAKKIINVELKKELLAILKEMVDVIIVPTTIIPAPRFDELDVIDIGGTVMQTREALLRNTILFNSTGFPAVSMPIGLTKDKMPVGAEIIGPPFGEERILSLAYNYECVNRTHKFRSPPCSLS